jgi:hypothetical protein
MFMNRFIVIDIRCRRDTLTTEMFVHLFLQDQCWWTDASWSTFDVTVIQLLVKYSCILVFKINVAEHLHLDRYSMSPWYSYYWNVCASFSARWMLMNRCMLIDIRCHRDIVSSEMFVHLALQDQCWWTDALWSIFDVTLIQLLVKY